MTTQWAHLPNAAHIDRILVSLQENPDHWNEADVMRGNQWDKSWWTVRHELLKQQRYAAWDAAWRAAWNTPPTMAQLEVRAKVQDVVLGAVIALVVYDDCAYMLDSDPGELAILAAFGDPRAILLLSACNTFHSLKEIA